MGKSRHQFLKADNNLNRNLFNALAGMMLVCAASSSAVAQPANDNFAQGIPLLWHGTNLAISGTLSNATSEAGEPFLPGISSGQTAWWNWTAPSNGIVSLSVSGTGFSPLLTVYAGNALANLALVASNNYLACYESTNCGCHWRERSQITFHVARGQAYQIAVDSAVVTDTSWSVEFLSLTNPLPAGAVRGYSLVISNGIALSNVYLPIQTTNAPLGGNLQMTFGFTPAPVNDDFERRLRLSGNRVHLTASNLGATKQPGEPDHAGNPGGSSVWYSWTAPASGRVTVTTNNLPPYAAPSWYSLTDSRTLSTSVDGGFIPPWPPTCGSEFDPNPPPTFYPVFAAYTGTNLTSLVSANGLPLALDAYPNAIEFDVVKGRTYQIAFDGNGGTTGKIPLCLALTTPAVNDNFRNRIHLHGINVVATGFNAGATGEPGEPAASGSSGKSVWWSWTAPVSGPVTVDLTGSDYAFPVSVYSGSVLTNLAAVAAGSTSVTFSAVQGTTYQIAVYDHAGLTGAIQLKLQAPVVELPLVQVLGNERVALLRYAASDGQVALLQRSPDDVTWQNAGTAVARASRVQFFAMPAPATNGPFYRAIVVDLLAY